MNRLIHTRPYAQVTQEAQELAQADYVAGQAHIYLLKSADAPVTTHALSGELYLSNSGWILLSVPNALVRGAFDALNEPGIELPLSSKDRLNAHITVMRPDEVESLGGANKITERGHHFHYTLGPIKEVNPVSWTEMSRVWFIEVKSKELQALRKSYGLTPLPKDNKHEFHITIGTRRKNILRNNEVSKAAGAIPSLSSLQMLSDVIPALDTPEDPTLKEDAEENYLDKLHAQNRLLKRIDYKNRKKPQALEQLVKESDIPAPRRAVIIRGNPQFAMYPKEQEHFYNSIHSHLKDRGYDVSFDPGEPYTTPPPADLWVGHSRGADRLRFAPPETKTFSTEPHEHEKAKVHAATQRELAKALGFKSVAELPNDLRTEPPVEHYLFTDQMRKALDDTIGYRDPSVLTNSLEKSVENGKNYGWVGPATLGAGVAGLGTAALMALKEGEDHGPIDHVIEEEKEDGMAEVHEDEEDFDCKPEALDAIYKYYDKDDSHLKQATLGNHKFEMSDLYEAPEHWAHQGYDKAKLGLSGTYHKLEKRYGPAMAKTIIGAGLIGAPLPGPGTGLITAAPFLAAGELMHAFKGDYIPPKDENEARERKNKRNSILKLLGSIAAPTAGAGAAAYALHKPTDTSVPSQVTRFPTEDKARVIRGRVAHDAPASTFEDTGDAYVFAGPSELTRSHGVVEDSDSLRKLVQEKVPADKKLGLLELIGHGAYSGQGIGEGKEVIAPKTVKHVTENFNKMPWSSNDPKYFQIGCNSGICEPKSPITKPEKNWMKYLSDNTGVTAHAPRGYVSTDDDTGLNQDIHITARDPGSPYTPPVPAGPNNAANESYAWSKYVPGKDPQRIVDSDKDTTSKRTYSSMPNNKLFELLYNMGKPSAIAGSLAAPFLSNRTAARNTAMLSSALAAPMALSEIATRYGEAAGKNDLGQGSGLMNHLQSQSKALPYVALAGLPLASYGLANYLGRWDHDKDEDKDKDNMATHQTVGSAGGLGTGMALGSPLGPIGASAGGLLGSILGARGGEEMVMHNKRKESLS